MRGLTTPDGAELRRYTKDSTGSGYIPLTANLAIPRISLLYDSEASSSSEHETE
jgi:hypothetical protein